MSNARVKARIITGAAVSLAVVATSMLTGASGASAHTAHQMERLAPYLANHPQGDMLANYMGGDGSLMRAWINSRLAGR